MRLQAVIFSIVNLWLLTAIAVSAEIPQGDLYAWYDETGLKADGGRVLAWADHAGTSSNRALDRVFGQPQVVLVATPEKTRPSIRLNGKSAIWAAVQGWGTIKSERTVVLFARIHDRGEGVILDGSTRVGSTPVRMTAEGWQTKATGTMKPTPTWQPYVFQFDSDGTPLGGFILGANVATQDGLECDIAEVLIYSRKLSADEIEKTQTFLKSKWGECSELPPSEQPVQTKQSTRASDSRVFWKTLRRQGDDGVHTYRIPGLATTPKGTLIAVFDARNKSGADLPGDIDVAMVRSTDDGETWSSMQRIIDFDSTVPGSQGNGVGDPAVLVDQKSGAIFVAALWSQGNRAWNGSGPGLTPEQTGQFVLVRSDDDGLTWSKPVSITEQIKKPDWNLCFNGPGNGIQLGDGTLVFPAQFKEAKKDPATGKSSSVPHSCFIYSKDEGSNWKISPAAIPEGIPTSECAIAELDDGGMLLTMRDESRSGKRAWAKWEWNADRSDGKWTETWSLVNDPTCMASLIRHPHGELIFSNPNHSQKRVALTIRSSRDGGKSWGDGRLLDPNGAMYSSLTVLKNGTIGVLYESTQENGLVFARFPLDWVLEGATPPNVAEGRMETTGKFGWWLQRHADKLTEVKSAKPDLVFLGDSITQGWEKAGKPVWDEFYGSRKGVNLGFGGDSTQHVLWRIENGEFDGIKPQVIVLLIGTNNVRHSDRTEDEIAGGVQEILKRLEEKVPESKVLLLGILPRGHTSDDAMRVKCQAVNERLAKLDDGKRVIYLDIGTQLLESDGTLSSDVAPDMLHLSEKGYRIMAEAIEPKLRELLKQ